jgi:hypothetical protein
MTNYFFDLVDRGTCYADAEGLALATDDHAISEARRIMGDVVRDGLADDAARSIKSEMAIVIRTAEIDALITVRMTLSIEIMPLVAAH